MQFNSLGLPLRPGEPECAFYMRNYRWAAGQSNRAVDVGVGCAEVALHAWACNECGSMGIAGMAACQVALVPTAHEPAAASSSTCSYRVREAFTQFMAAERNHGVGHLLFVLWC